MGCGRPCGTDKEARWSTAWRAGITAGSLSGLRYCRDALYQPVPGDGVLAGEVLLTGPAHAAPATDRLYSSHAGETQACNLRAIPYFAWNNRGADEMDVWLPLQ